jgi:N-acetylmuramoyl-L-alanine amidase
VGAVATNDRGVRRARFVVLRNATMPSVLVEGGFMSDPEEAKRIYSVAGRDQLARAIADGVLAYKRLVER